MADAVWAGQMPELYDTRLGPALFGPFAQELAARAARLGPARVLELAAGTGVVTRALLDALPGAEVVATDLNEAMVAWGRQHVPAAQWRTADAQALVLPDSSFDLVVCAFGVMFFPDKVLAHREARRVLQPGGTLLITVWDVLDASPFPAALTAALREVLPDRTPDFVVRVPHGYADVAQVEADLGAGGLEVQDVERVVLSGSAPTARDLAEGFCLGTPLRFELEVRGDLRALTDAVGDAMTTRLGPGPVSGDLAAIVATARRPERD